MTVGLIGECWKLIGLAVPRDINSWFSSATSIKICIPAVHIVMIMIRYKLQDLVTYHIDYNMY